MHSQGAHIITRCKWDTAFDSKSLAHQFQMDISSWSSYKMKQIINRVFDSVCPQNQTLKIKKLGVDLGEITYENMLSELPLRLEEALRTALYDLIMYPKKGDETLEIVHKDIAQINLLRDFLLQGMLPWNYQNSYGTSLQIINYQLANNRFEVIKMIQEIGVQANVRKRIAWQFSNATIKKIIVGLEPNNHYEIISFTEEFIKVQEKEIIVQISVNELRKNIWLWVLNYLFTDRGTIFNKVAFVRSTIEQMANHFNISYNNLIEMIESAIGFAKEYSQVDKGVISILKILSEELYTTSFSRTKTKKQKENFWKKVAIYFNSPIKRSNSKAKNEFNELVINLPKLDALRFQKIALKIHQKETVWKAILEDLIPAAVESLFVAISPSQSKNILAQIAFLSKLPKSSAVKIDTLDLYTFGIAFCVTHQNTSIGKNAFLDFVIQKLAYKQQQSKLVVLNHLLDSNIANVEKKTSFISFYNELQSLYKNEIATTKTFSSEKTIQQLVSTYISEIQYKKINATRIHELEKTLQKWIATSPTAFWKAILSVEKTQKNAIHFEALISLYGTEKFLKTVASESFEVLIKVKQIIDVLIAKQPKNAFTLRGIKNALISSGFEVLWKYGNQHTTTFFTYLLQSLVENEGIDSTTSIAVKEAIQLLLNAPKINRLAWSLREFDSILEQHKKYVSQTPVEAILELITLPKQQDQVAKEVSRLVRSKKIATTDFKAKEGQIISYLVTNGIQLRKRLITDFLKQFSKVNTSFNTVQITTILHDCFWQSLVEYQDYKGNEDKFTGLFTATVLETFPFLKKQTKSTQKNEILLTPYKIEMAALFEILKDNLQHTNAIVEVSTKQFSFATLFAIAIETSPAKVVTILKETVSSQKQLTFLKATIVFEEFVVLIAHGAVSLHSAVFKAIHVLFVLVKQLGSIQIITTLETVFWKQTIAILQGKQSANKVLAMLVATSFDQLSEISTLDQITIVKHIQNSSLKIPENLKNVLVKRNRVFELVSSETKRVEVSKALKSCAEKNQLDMLSKHLMTTFSIPTWFQNQEAYNYHSIVNELIKHQPLIVLKTIRSQHFSTVQLAKFAKTIHFKVFISSLLKLYPLQQKALTDLQKLYTSVASISMRGISYKSLQEIIIRKVVVAWQTSRWSLVTPENIWNELLWETCGKKSIRKKDFIDAFNSIKTMLPASLQVTYNSFSSFVKPVPKTPLVLEYINKNKSLMGTELIKFPKEGVSIPNAGLVMLNTYFLMLLERLGAIENRAFVSKKAQLDAIHYLQYIVTGLTKTEESLLTLNKILVGLPPNMPVTDSVDINLEQKQLIDGMIQASINHWTAIGETSINGFRGNWLVREGILRETEDRWELTVEKRPYDILMIKSPFSFSIIKLPWMLKPLHVTWPF
jgi:hypothetical protein